jgi:sugar phosphate isomerase/epimerase
MEVQGAETIMKSSHELNRRMFIQNAAGLVLSARALAAQVNGSSGDQSEPWVVACRDNLLKTTKQPDSWSAMKELGVAGVEVEVNPDLACPGLYGPATGYSLATDADIRLLRDDLARNRLVITAFLMNNRFDERLEDELEWMKKVASAAQELNVKVIRIDVVPRRTPAEKFLPFAVRACRQLCDIVGGTSICYGIENHGSITNDPEFLRGLFDGVGSPHLGLTLDTANFYWYGHPLDRLYEIFERFASRVFHTHCKSIRFPEDKKNVQRPMGWEYGKYAAPIYEGDIDFARVAAILRKAGYSGDLCLENESLGKYPDEQHAEILKKEVALLGRLSRRQTGDLTTA